MCSQGSLQPSSLQSTPPAKRDGRLWVTRMLWEFEQNWNLISFPVPSSPPRNVILVNKTSKSIFIKWEAILTTRRNGEISGYKVNYTLQPRKNRNSSNVICVVMAYVNLTRLRTSKRYDITVLAFNQHGDGPPSEILAVQTDEESKFR